MRLAGEWSNLAWRFDVHSIPLLPCPFCGSEAYISLKAHTGVCKDCGAEGPVEPLDAPATNWNRRAYTPVAELTYVNEDGEPVTVELSGPELNRALHQWKAQALQLQGERDAARAEAEQLRTLLNTQA